MASDLAAPNGQKKLEGRYTADDVEVSLRLLAYNGGNIDRTITQLASEGRALSDRTLKKWRETIYARRYAELCREVANDVASNAAGEAMEIAAEAAEAERIYVRRALDKIHEVPARDLARAAQSLSQVKTAQIHSARLLREQPTSIQETRDVGELIDLLRQEGVFRDSSVKGNLVEAEVVEEKESGNSPTG